MAKKTRFTAGRTKTNGKGKPAKGARSQVLPGLEQVRDHLCDGYLEDIADARKLTDRGAKQEAEAKRRLLKRMAETKQTQRTHAGYKATIQPGETKIGIRQAKDEETIDVIPSDAGAGADA